MVEWELHWWHAPEVAQRMQLHNRRDQKAKMVHRRGRADGVRIGGWVGIKSEVKENGARPGAKRMRNSGLGFVQEV